MNSFDISAPSTVEFVKIGKVKGITLDDRASMASIEDTKWFYIDFETLGAGTCLHMDFKDGVEKVYGDKEFCDIWKPDVDYVFGQDMDLPVELPHVYQYADIFKTT